MRPSTVTASLVGPDRVPGKPRPESANRALTRSRGRAARPKAPPETEGQWRWVINATDDQAQESKVERSFDLNNTIGYLRVRPPALSSTSAAATCRSGSVLRIRRS